jgi:transcriptional regulator with XRE-family HTH domain
VKYTNRDFEQAPFDIEVIEETALAMAQSTIQGAINSCRISRAALAEKMGRPRSFVSRMLSGEHNLTIKTLARALAACGYQARFEYVPIQLPLVVTSTPAQAETYQDHQAGLPGSPMEPQVSNANLALAA